MKPFLLCLALAACAGRPPAMTPAEAMAICRDRANSVSVWADPQVQHIYHSRSMESCASEYRSRGQVQPMRTYDVYGRRTS